MSKRQLAEQENGEKVNSIEGKGDGDVSKSKDDQNTEISNIEKDNRSDVALELD